MKVYLRANGNNKIGYGHLTRLLSFAQALYSSYELVLITYELPEYLKREYLQYVSFIQEISFEDKKVEANSISKFLTKEDIIIVDGYEFDKNYFQIIKSTGAAIIRISDYVEDVEHVDIVINHGGAVNFSDYTSSIDCIFYLGTKYSLIRMCFISTNQKFEKGRILLCLGGTSNEQLLTLITEALLSVGAVKGIDIITSQQTTIVNPLISYHKGLSDKKMAELMGKAECVICPASSLSYEAAMVHTGLIVGILADNQLGQYNFLIDNELAIGVGRFHDMRKSQMIEVIKNYLGSSERLRNSQNQKEIFDGNAPERLKRIVDKLVKLSELEIYEATLDHTELLFKWVTDPEVRRNAINTNPVKYEDHKAWVASVLQNDQRLLYIVYHNEKPIAQIRFDIENELATLSYSIDISYRGKGYGEIIVRLGIKKLISDNQQIKRIKAVVQEQNVPSNKVFETCNFVVQQKELINNIPFNIYYKG